MTSSASPSLPQVSRLRIASLAAMAMFAFAGNSLLCRMALAQTAIDAASFTGIRLLSGALVLWLLLKMRASSAMAASQVQASQVQATRGQATRGQAAQLQERGSWISAFALFAYAAAFSLAYTQLTAATGALLLFGSVQVTMIAVALWRGERMAPPQVAGVCLAVAGLVALLLPGLSSPPLLGAVLMIAAGAAWGVYSLRGRRARDPLASTSGNFVRTLPFAALFIALMIGRLAADAEGAGYAIASGALTSGIGYAIWYAALPHLGALRAAVLQLSVPVITAAGGVLLIGEPITLRFVSCSVAILGGVLVVILLGRRGT
jgi:drug/metabolite transporter (DMT)-like permease